MFPIVGLPSRAIVKIELGQIIASTSPNITPNNFQRSRSRAWTSTPSTPHQNTHLDILSFMLSIDSQFLGERFPLGIDQRFGFRVHGDLIGPGTGEAFGRPLARGVDAHLGAVVRQAGSVVERID